MANYSSMIKGTIKALGSKARQFAEDNAVRDVYDRSTTTAKCYANIAKLTVVINGELEDEEKLFSEIGRLCYATLRDAPPEELAELFGKVAEADGRIEALREELAAVKAAVAAARSGTGTEPEQL